MSGKNIKSFAAMATILLIALTVIPAGKAQQTTEKFIPIGMSPGISNKVSFQGKISGVDQAARSFSIQVDGSSKTFNIASSTRIWLDRSKVRKPNIDGSFGDLEPGRRIEIKYDPDNPAVASWIKIEAQ